MSTKRREYEYGRLVSVDIVPLGDNLAADATAGATSITVEDACDFDEDGGLLLLAGVVYAYSTWTEDDSTGVGTITLSGTLAASLTEGTVVAVYDPMYATAASDKVAQVEVVGDDGNVDTLEADIALHLVDKIDEGVRGLNGEQVKLELEGDEWVIVDIFGLAGGANGGASGPKWEADDRHVLTSADITAGTVTFPLSHRPILESVLAMWGVLPQEPTEYTVNHDDQTITWPLEGFEEAGQTLWVHYEYLQGVGNLIDIPTSYEWRYATGLGSSTSYAQPGFDDSAWASGQTDMGYGGGGIDINTTLSPLSNVWQRTHFISAGGDLTIAAAQGHDDAATVYLDGVQVYTAGFTATPVSITVAAPAGPHVVAVYGVDSAAGAMRIGFTISEAM